MNICKIMQVEKDLSIKRIRSDHGREFENHKFSTWCDEMSIKHEFSAPKTPQKNGVTERKNRTFLNMATCMLTYKDVAKRFSAKAVNTACYVSNWVFIRSSTSKTAYELWYEKKPNVKYFKVFGSICYVPRDRKNLRKFDSKSDEAIFLGYFLRSKAYQVFNKRTVIMEESINVVIDDRKRKSHEEDELTPPITNEEEVVEAISSYQTSSLHDHGRIEDEV